MIIIMIIIITIINLYIYIIIYTYIMDTAVHEGIKCKLHAMTEPILYRAPYPYSPKRSTSIKSIQIHSVYSHCLLLAPSHALA